MLPPVIARGDQRSRMNDSIAWSALRFSLPLIMSERNAGEPIEKAGNDESVARLNQPAAAAALA